MSDLNDSGFFYIDGIDDVMAAYVNELLASLIKGRMTNVVTITATLALTDASLPIQSIAPSGANRVVTLAAEAETNHLQAIYNAGTTYTLTVMDDGQATTLATIQPGQMVIFHPVGGTAWVVAKAQGELAGFIDGLEVEYVSTSSIKVKTGAAYVPSLGRVIRVSADITVTGISLGVSAWGYVYLYENSSGQAAIEVSTTAPATSAYYGTARTKNGDTSRRFLRAIRTDSSGNILYDVQHSNRIQYKTTSNTTNRVLAAGAATTVTEVSASALIPAYVVTSIEYQAINLSASSQIMYLYSASGGNLLFQVQPSTRLVVEMFTSSTSIYYLVTASGGTVYIDIIGYSYER